MGSMRVLVAEDEPDIRFLYEAMIGRTDLELVSVGDGEEAVARATGEVFDYVILDLRMPVLDGWSACRRLRDHGLDVPIIVVSAAPTKELDQALAAGADLVVDKPVMLGGLIRRLTEVMADGGDLGSLAGYGVYRPA